MTFCTIIDRARLLHFTFFTTLTRLINLNFTKLKVNEKLSILKTNNEKRNVSESRNGQRESKRHGQGNIHEGRPKRRGWDRTNGDATGIMHM